VGLGIAQLFVLYPWLTTVLRYGAVVYFMWMAWHLLGIRVTSGKAQGRPMYFYEAALFQWINPKAWAMATSYIGALMVEGEGRMGSVLWITAGALTLAPFSSALWMVSGQQLARLLRQGRMEKILGIILALLMLGAAVLVFLEPQA
jgi:threonine/homoserine/homoserine lactone efflux protein